MPRETVELPGMPRETVERVVYDVAAELGSAVTDQDRLATMLRLRATRGSPPPRGSWTR